MLISIFKTNNGFAQDPSFYKMINQLTTGTVPSITSEKLKVKEDFILLDVRSKEEYDLSHIKNAIWVGEGDWNLNLLNELEKDKTIIAYCSVGYRSEKLVEYLISINFKDVYNLYGGIFDWKNKGNPIENSSGKTEKIHGYNKKFSKWIKNGAVFY